MKFLKCFWIPEQQALVVGVCALLVVLPVTFIGILVKSVSIILFLFFMVGILFGGFSINKERVAMLKAQRAAVIQAGDVKLDIIIQSPKSYRLKASNKECVVVFDQEYRSVKQAMKEVQYWSNQRPNLTYTINQTIEEELFD